MAVRGGKRKTGPIPKNVDIYYSLRFSGFPEALSLSVTDVEQYFLVCWITKNCSAGIRPFAMKPS